MIRGRCALLCAIVGMLGTGWACADVITSTWSGGSGNWSSAANWSPSGQYPNNGNGGNTYDAIVTAGASTLSEDIVVDQAEISGHSISGAYSLSVLSSMTLAGATFGNASVSSSGATSINLGINWLDASALQLGGTTSWNEGAYIIGNNGATITNNGTFTGRSLEYYLWGSVGSRPSFINNGVYINETMNTFQDVNFVNAGTVYVPLMRMQVTGATTYNNTYTQTAGRTVFGTSTTDSVLTVPGTMVVQGGRLEGAGFISGNLNSNGTISPGFDDGESILTRAIYASGSATLGENSVLEIDLASPTDYDQFSNGYGKSGGGIVIDGELVVRFANAFENSVSSTDEFYIATWGSVSGSFNNISSGDRLVTSDGHGSFLVEYGGVSLANYVRLSDYQSVPEPNSAVVLVVTAALPILRRRCVKG